MDRKPFFSAEHETSLKTERSSDIIDGIHASLRASRAATEWFVVMRRDKFGPVIIVYVVPARPVSVEEIERLIHAKSASNEYRITVVRMSALPRISSGEIDSSFFYKVPVLSSSVKRRAINMLYEGKMKQVYLKVGEAPLTMPPGILTASKVTETVLSDDSQRHRVSAIVHGPELEQKDGKSPVILSKLLEQAATSGNVIHFVNNKREHRRVTYAEILDRASRIASGLHQVGVEVSQPVLLQCGDNEKFLLSFWACQIAGAIPVPCTAPSAGFADAVNERLEEVWKILGNPPIITDDVSRLPINVRGSVSIFRPEDLERNDPLDPALVPTTASALMLLTSGSTGIPKLVTQTHEAVFWAVLGMQQENSFTPADISLNWFPLDHVVGIIMCNIRDTLTQCEQIHVSTSLILSDPLLWLDLLSEYAVTTTWAPNFVYSLVASRSAEFVGKGWDLSNLRAIINGGEMVVAEQTMRFVQLLTPFGLRRGAIQPMWGMSETCSGVTYSHTHIAPHESEAMPGIGPVSVGRPISGLSLRIVNDESQIVLEGVEGHLEVTGPVVTRGYFNNDKANADSFTDDGWFRTGDRAFLDDGALTLVGRTKDEILINGVNIPASEVEAVAERVKGTRKSFTAAVAYRTATSVTDQLVVFFCPLEGYDPVVVSRDINTGIRKHFGFSAKRVIAVKSTDLPKTAIGKIQRSKLVESLRAGEFEISDDEGGSDQSGVWLSQPTWKPVRVASSAVSGRRCFVVVDSNNSESDDLIRILRHKGHTLSRVTWSSVILVDADVTDIVLSLPSRSSACPGSVHELVNEQVNRIEEIASIVRDLNNRRDGAISDVRLTVLTYGTDIVSGHEISDPVHAAIRSFVVNLAAEYTWLSVRSVDVEPGRPEDGLIEILNEVDDRRIAYRNGCRWVMRFQGIADLGELQDESLLKQRGAYLVAGGMGGIGVELCRHLLNRHEARVIVIGRRPKGEVSRELEDLSRLGEISYIQADFSDQDAIERALMEHERHWNQQILGAFHLAGQLDSGTVQGLTVSGLRRTLVSKVRPAEVLGDVMLSRGGFVVAFSSVNALFGGPGVAAYGAANGYLEAWANALKNRGVPHQVILWSQWSGVGMSVDGSSDELIGALGYRALSVHEGMAALEAVLKLPSGCSVVGLLPNNLFVAAQVVRDPEPLDRLMASGEIAEGASYTGPLKLDDEFGVSASISVSVQNHVSEPIFDPDLLAIVKEIWVEILGGREISDNIGFFDAGVGSLHLPRAQLVIEERLGIRLDIMDFFRSPTTIALAKRIAQLISEVGTGAKLQEPKKPNSDSQTPTSYNHLNGSNDLASRMHRLRSARKEF
ncbi:SDR family NAD(P)-dependent oxidoreductase [Paenibacillus xylanexedens]|uniref:SDR family NAD(P)-dependent oxidoreductase n=1 Tax=Paenibacillus xylanexedens TaxID=528191 RepID=UPI003B027394